MVAQRRPVLMNPDPERDPKGWVTRRTEREIEGLTEFQIPEIVTILTDEIRSDPGLLAACLRVALRQWVDEVVRLKVHEQRHDHVFVNPPAVQLGVAEPI